MTARRKPRNRGGRVIPCSVCGKRMLVVAMAKHFRQRHGDQQQQK